MSRVSTFLIALLCLPAPAAAALTVILTRHAEVVVASTDPSLSQRGQARAKTLSAMLRDSNIEAVYISEFARTKQTAQPTADRFHLTPLKFAGANVNAVAESLRRRTSGTVLVVGHSNTVPQIISALGGPAVTIGETEFDNLFVLTVQPAGVSLLRLRYGSDAASPAAADMRDGAMLGNGSVVMKIEFAKSGGFAGPIRSVRGTVTFKDGKAEVSSSDGYHRQLAPDESSTVRAATDPAELTRAAAQIKPPMRGAADLDHYQITVTTDDGKTHNIDLNTSGGTSELQGMAPSVGNLVRWVKQESASILAHRAGAK